MTNEERLRILKSELRVYESMAALPGLPRPSSEYIEALQRDIRLLEREEQA